VAARCKALEDVRAARCSAFVGSPVRDDAPIRGARLYSGMSEAPSRQVLVVANLTESAPRLLEEVEQRARGGCAFTLMVPPERHPDAPDWSPEDALELVRRAAKGRPVELVPSGADAAATVGDLVRQSACDEILLSTPPEHHAHWHRHNLPKQIQALDIPVRVIPPDPTGWSHSHGFPNDWVEVGPLT
jgi:hypothetical protein